MNNERKSIYILAVSPHESAKLKLFESGAGSISEIFQTESGFRYAGWDLYTGDRPKIIKGEYLEAKIDEVKKIDVYEDGRFVCWFAADHNYLAWPLNPDEFRQKPRLNPLAIIEATYNFVNFYRKLIPFFIDPPKKFRFVVQLKNAFLDENVKLYLIPGGLQSMEWLMNRPDYAAPDNDMDAIVDIDMVDLNQGTGYVAYSLIEKLYLWFGIDKTFIPYVSKENGREIIDIEKIKKNKGL